MVSTINGISKTAGLCGGRACIAGHRIPVWGLVRYRQLGLSDAKILEAYPSLTSADLAAAWEYYATHREEIEHDIRENEEDEEIEER